MANRKPLVLFLDIDGVLHPGIPTPEERFIWLPILAELLAKAPAQVDVVVHSSWRLEKSLQQLKAAMPGLAPWIVDVTNDDIDVRWESIRDYLKTHRVKSFRILDDHPHAFPGNYRRLIVCNPATGVSSEEVQAQLRNWLHK